MATKRKADTDFYWQNTATGLLAEPLPFYAPSGGPDNLMPRSKAYRDEMLPAGNQFFYPRDAYDREASRGLALSLVAGSVRECLLHYVEVADD